MVSAGYSVIIATGVVSVGWCMYIDANLSVGFQVYCDLSVQLKLLC